MKKIHKLRLFTIKASWAEVIFAHLWIYTSKNIQKNSQNHLKMCLLYVNRIKID